MHIVDAKHNACTWGTTRLASSLISPISPIRLIRLIRLISPIILNKREFDITLGSVFMDNSC